MLHRQNHLQTLRLLHYSCGKSPSGGESPLKTAADSAPTYQRFVLGAATHNGFLPQHLCVNLSVAAKAGAEMSRP